MTRPLTKPKRNVLRCVPASTRAMNWSNVRTKGKRTPQSKYYAFVRLTKGESLGLKRVAKKHKTFVQSILLEMIRDLLKRETRR